MTKGELGGRRILVVEDDYFLAMDSRKWLEQAGAEVLGPVGRSEQAGPLIVPGGLDAAVLDINLGPGPSFELARQLKEEHIPFVFMTGYDRSAIPVDYAEAPRLQKPVGGVELVKAVASIC